MHKIIDPKSLATLQLQIISVLLSKKLDFNLRQEGV